MTMKVTIWLMCLLFVATLVNVVSAYSSMDDIDVQGKFRTMGILGGAQNVSTSTADQIASF